LRSYFAERRSRRIVLTAFKAYSAWLSAQELPVSDQGRAETDPIQIRDISGLEPVKANVNTTPFGSVDGEAFTGASVPKRNIVITFGLNPDWDTWTIRSLRRLLESYFMPKQATKLEFESDDMSTVQIAGYVESFEPNLFSKDPEIQVSVICPDPYFTAIDPVVATGLSSDEPKEIDYSGTIETGFVLEVSFANGLSPTLITVDTGNNAPADFSMLASVDASKYLMASSVQGKKFVQNVAFADGRTTNLLNAIQPGYFWPTLQPGVNMFDLVSDVGVQDWQLTYFERFGGL
jgi:hypothetical protein